MKKFLIRGAAVLLCLAPLTALVEPSAPPVRTIPTGAGFSLSISRPADAVHSTAARLETWGLPAFGRYARRRSQVVIGPYASIDEAEMAQRRLASRGFRGRLLVDESVRRAAGYDGVSHLTGDVRVLLVPGAGRLSIVVELPSQPRQVFTRRESFLEIEAGPIDVLVPARTWDAPAGVELFEQATLEPADDGLRLRIALPQTTQTNTRVVGSRLYVDLWSLETEVLGRVFAEVAEP